MGHLNLPERHFWGGGLKIDLAKGMCGIAYGYAVGLTRARQQSTGCHGCLTPVILEFRRMHIFWSVNSIGCSWSTLQPVCETLHTAFRTATDQMTLDLWGSVL